MKTFVIVMLLLLSGCNYVANKAGYEKVSVARAKIEEIKSEGERAVAEKEIEIKSKLTEVIDKQVIQIQSAANSLFGASLTRPLYEQETRVMLITFNRIDEAKSALGVGPTLEAMKAEQDRLVKELDEKLTSLSELKRVHEETVKEKEGLVSATELAKNQVKILEEEKAKKELEYKNAIIAEQEKLSKLQDKLLDAEAIAKARHEAIEANKRLLMIALGVLSIVGLVIAIYLPLFKKQGFTFAAITGAGAIMVPFVEPIHFAIVFTLALLIGLYVIFKKVGIISQGAANSFNSIQEYKEKNPTEYEKLRPILEEYNKKYVGNEKVEDRAVTGYIKEVLRDYEKV